MSLSNSERQEFELIIRSVMEPLIHELECRIAKGISRAFDDWANLIADIQFQQAEMAMSMRDKDRDVFFARMKEMEAKRAKVKGFSK